MLPAKLPLPLIIFCERFRDFSDHEYWRTSPWCPSDQARYTEGKPAFIMKIMRRMQSERERWASWGVRMADEISRDIAIAACERIRGENRRRYLSAAHWQCWGCMKFGGVPEKRCMRTADGWNGCTLIDRYLVKHA